MILLVSTIYNNRRIKDDSQTHDHYEAFESLAEAKECYDALINLDDTRSASICSIIESTDYESNNLDLINQFHTFEWENRNFGKWFKAKGYNQKQIDAIAYGEKEVE